MEIKKNWRELSLIVLGVLVMISPFMVFDTILGWTEAILGMAIIVIGAWPLIPKKKLEKLA